MSRLSSAQTEAEIDKLGLLSESDYKDSSARKAVDLGLSLDELDARYITARKKHLEQMGVKATSVVFFGFASIDEVRAKLAELEPKLRDDPALFGKIHI